MFSEHDYYIKNNVVNKFDDGLPENIGDLLESFQEEYFSSDDDIFIGYTQSNIVVVKSFDKRLWNESLHEKLCERFNLILNVVDITDSYNPSGHKEEVTCMYIPRPFNEEYINMLKLEYDLDYYGAKSGSCEEGLFQKDKEIAKLEKENRTLKLLVQNWEQLDEEKDEQLEKMNDSLKRLVEEKKQLQQELFESEVDYYTETFRDDYEDRIIDLKKEFKERFGRDFEYG